MLEDFRHGATMCEETENGAIVWGQNVPPNVSKSQLKIKLIIIKYNDLISTVYHLSINL